MIYPWQVKPLEEVPQEYSVKEDIYSYIYLCDGMLHSQHRSAVDGEYTFTDLHRGWLGACSRLLVNASLESSFIQSFGALVLESLPSRCCFLLGLTGDVLFSFVATAGGIAAGGGKKSFQIERSGNQDLSSYLGG